MEEALTRSSAGEMVVLVLPPGRSAPPAPPPPGRLAVLVGDPADPASGEAAREMARELWAQVP